MAYESVSSTLLVSCTRSVYQTLARCWSSSLTPDQHRGNVWKTSCLLGWNPAVLFIKYVLHYCRDIVIVQYHHISCSEYTHLYQPSETCFLFFSAPAVTVGETEGAMDSASVLFFTSSFPYITYYLHR